MSNEPLVKELLTNEDVEAIINASDINHPEFDINNHLLLSKGWLTTWDGESHVGYIVHHMKTNSMKAYFMEVEKTEEPMIHNNTYYVYHNIRYHKWVPITVLPRDKRLEKFRNSIPIKSVDTLVNRIVSDAHDEWGVFPADTSKPAELTNAITLTYTDIGKWMEPIPADEMKHIQAAMKLEEERLEKELIERFSTGELPPPEDDLWYRVLADVDSRGFGDTSLETKILRILQRRGINAYIDGERDSFGWVTRGIFIDDKIMCIY